MEMFDKVFFSVRRLVRSVFMVISGLKLFCVECGWMWKPVHPLNPPPGPSYEVLELVPYVHPEYPVILEMSAVVKNVLREIEFTPGVKTRVQVPVIEFQPGKFNADDPNWQDVIRKFDLVRDVLAHVHLDKLEKCGAVVPDSAKYESMESPVSGVVRKVATRESPAGYGSRLKPGDVVEFLNVEQLMHGDPVRYFLGRTVFAGRGTYGVKGTLVRDVVLNKAWSTSQGRDRALAPGLVAAESAEEVTPGAVGIAGAAPKAGAKKVVKKVKGAKKVAKLVKGQQKVAKGLKKVKKFGMKAMK